MKLPETKLGIPLTAATLVYILCSLLGCLLYLVLPPFLCSIGARIHAYTLILYAMGDEVTAGGVIWMVLSHLYVLVTLVSGVVAIVKGNSRIFSLLVGFEIIFTFLFLIFQDDSIFSSTSGIVVNIAYCFWLFRRPVPQKAPVKKRKKSKKGK